MRRSTNGTTRKTSATKSSRKAKPTARTPKPAPRRRATKSKPATSSKQGFVRLSVALAPGILRRIDRRAKAAGVTRDEFIAACLRLGLSHSTARPPDGAATSKEVGAGLDQVLTWMADQQAVLAQLRESLSEVTAAVPVDNRPPTPEPGDDDDDDDEKPRRDKSPA